jgi:hypothetical protein
MTKHRRRLPALLVGPYLLVFAAACGPREADGINTACQQRTAERESACDVAPLQLHESAGGRTQISSVQSARKPVDTTQWKILVDQHGWSVRYPPSWQPETMEGDRADEAFQPILTGPKGCYQQAKECGFVQLGSGWRPPTPRQAALSAKDALLEGIPAGQNYILLRQGSTVLDGKLAYFIVYRMKLYGGYPNGVIFKEVEAKYRNQFYFIVFHEEGKNRGAISAINSPDGWVLNSVFSAIVSSFKFTGP